MDNNSFASILDDPIDSTVGSDYEVMNRRDIADSLFRAYETSYDKARYFESIDSPMSEYHNALCDGVRLCAIRLGVVDILNERIAAYKASLEVDA